MRTILTAAVAVALVLSLATTASALRYENHFVPGGVDEEVTIPDAVPQQRTCVSHNDFGQCAATPELPLPSAPPIPIVKWICLGDVNGIHVLGCVYF